MHSKLKSNPRRVTAKARGPGSAKFGTIFEVPKFGTKLNHLWSIVHEAHGITEDVIELGKSSQFLSNSAFILGIFKPRFAI